MGCGRSALGQKPKFNHRLPLRIAPIRRRGKPAVQEANPTAPCQCPVWSGLESHKLKSPPLVD
jgi:hypothetical protein